VKRRFPGLHQAAQPAEVPDGLYLVRVQRAQYRWYAKKPYYAIQFSVLEPKQFACSLISGADLLHRKSTVETDLVLARLWL
jgi:hypothetical protein